MDAEDIVRALPAGFDSVDLGELLDVIDELRDYSRYGSMHAIEGENEAWERAGEVLAKWRIPAVEVKDGNH